MKKFNRQKVKKILVIKPAAIGDVLLATPVIENLRHNFPDAEINFLTQKFCKEALTGNEFLSNALTYDLKYDSTSFLIKHLAGQKYDLVIDLFGNPRTAIITYMIDARYRVGYKFNWRRFAYNIKVTPRRKEVHNIEFNLDSLRQLGLEIITSKPRFVINSIHREFADNFFIVNGLKDEEVIGFNPHGTWKTKVWQPEKFAELGKMLAEKYYILIFWGSNEEKLYAEKISNEIGKRSCLIPEADIKYSGALTLKCSLFVTNDTGPMHIAWILGANTAAIYGPTIPELQGPKNSNSIIIQNKAINCLGCNLTKIEECPNEHKCMRDLSPEEVYKQIITFLKGTNSIH